MARFLLFLALGFGVIMVFRMLMGKRSGTQDSTDDPTQQSAKPAPVLEACPHCGVHMEHTELIEHIKQTHVQ